MIRVSAFLVGLALSSAASGQIVEWMGQTVKWSPTTPAGNGCNGSDTQVFVFGDTVSWVFNNLGVNLTAGFPPGSDNKYCAIRARAEVAQGIYLGELKQALTFGGIKSKNGSRGAISTNSTFFGYSVSPFEITFPEGVEYNQALVTRDRIDNFSVIAPPKYWCNPGRNHKGLFTSRIAVNGQVTTPGASITISAQQFDVKFEATFGWRPCSV